MEAQIEKFDKLFNGKPLVCTYQGEPHIPLKALGVVLGYSEEGEGLVNTWGGSWKSEFKAGHHYKILKGESLKNFKKLAALTNSALVSPNAPNLVLLTLSGVNRVLLLTGKPVGLKLRDWLDSEVLPSIRKTGQYGMVSKLQKDPKLVVDGSSVLFRTFSEMRKQRLISKNDHALLLKRVIDLQFQKYAKDLGLAQTTALTVAPTNVPALPTGNILALPPGPCNVLSKDLKYHPGFPGWLPAADIGKPYGLNGDQTKKFIKEYCTSVGSDLPNKDAKKFVESQNQGKYPAPDAHGFFSIQSKTVPGVAIVTKMDGSTLNWRNYWAPEAVEQIQKLITMKAKSTNGKPTHEQLEMPDVLESEPA